MRLSTVLSKKPDFKFVQVEPFLVGKQGNCGQKVDLDIGTVALNYFCENCDDLRTFLSKGKLSCIFVNRYLISIDCVLECTCGSKVEVWFLIESENDITSYDPKVRILKHSEKLSPTVHPKANGYGEYDAMLNKAERAYREELGAGSIVYLRKIYESVTLKMADSYGIRTTDNNGYRRPFKKILTEVDKKCNIIPSEFSENGYKLFGELSDIVHGEYDEDTGLKKFEPLNRLVIGILENIRNREELKKAMSALGWDDE